MPEFTKIKILPTSSLPITDIAIVEKLIPQAEPFLMVDALLEFSVTHLKSGFTIPAENIFCENGKFQAPGILEHQAQSVALHTGFQYFLKGEAAPVGYLGAVKIFEVKKIPKVGETLETDVEILAEMEGITLVKTTTKLAGETISTAELKTILA